MEREGMKTHIKTKMGLEPIPMTSDSRILYQRGEETI